MLFIFERLIADTPVFQAYFIRQYGKHELICERNEMQTIIRPLPPAAEPGESMAEREKRYFLKLDQLEKRERRKARRRRILRYFGL